MAEASRFIRFLPDKALKEFMLSECLRLIDDKFSVDVLIHPDSISDKYVKYGLFDGLDLIGFAVVNVEEDSTALARLYVKPEARRSGAGTMLLNASKPSHLLCNSENKSALTFYDKNGYVVTTPEDSYFHILESKGEVTCEI